jgi:hypothetical protein
LLSETTSCPADFKIDSMSLRSEYASSTTITFAMRTGLLARAA